MKFLNVDIDLKNKPILDKTFIPLFKFNEAFAKTANDKLSIAIERNGGLVSVFNTKIHGTIENQAADFYYVERIVKFLLWAKGGFKVTICGNETIYKHIKQTYSANGERSFDCKFMAKVYEKPFEVNFCEWDKFPVENENPMPIGRNLDGCRIGFDAGGSDRKVSAVVNGECVFSEEVVWYPKITEDPTYHYDEIVKAFKTAASYMPRVDAIGISSAGIYVNNRTMVASLFLKVPENAFDAKVKDIYINAAKEIGDVPIEVANDGDVTALAGAMDLEDTRVFGVAMGTSEAVGYVDKDGYVTGWLNELAFAPIDGQADAMVDEWSGDIGCGVKYFSQDGVIKLAKVAGIELDCDNSPAQNLKTVQSWLNKGDKRAIEIYETIGAYLAHTLPLYTQFYDIKHVLLLGRVMSGKGGNIILNVANKILKDEYPTIANILTLNLPDETSRRVGQSVAAASLPKIIV